MFFNILFMFLFVLCVFCVFVLFCVLFLLLYTAVSFLILIQVYRLLPPGGNPVAVNKYRIISYHIIQYQRNSLPPTVGLPSALVPFDVLKTLYV